MEGKEDDDHTHMDPAMRHLMDDLGITMDKLMESSIFVCLGLFHETNLQSGDEEKFAFARALSRLVQMGSEEWVDAGIDCPPHAA